MKTSAVVVLSTLLAAGVSSLIIPDTAIAGGPFNMMNPSRAMNPSRWFGNNRRYNDDYYYDDHYYGAPGYGYGAPGYAVPGYGYGVPGYGYGAPGYGYSAPVQPAPVAPAASSGGDSSAKIQALEERIRQLEASQAPTAPAYEGSGYPAPVPQSAPYAAPPASGNNTPMPGTNFRPTN